MTVSSQQFGKNIEFLRFLHMANTDPATKSALQNGDHSAIDSFPGLSSAERDHLKMIDWTNMTIDVSDATLQNFNAGSATDGSCETRISPIMIERRCWS